MRLKFGGVAWGVPRYGTMRSDMLWLALLWFKCGETCNAMLRFRPTRLGWPRSDMIWYGSSEIWFGCVGLRGAGSGSLCWGLLRSGAAGLGFKHGEVRWDGFCSDLVC